MALDSSATVRSDGFLLPNFSHNECISESLRQPPYAHQSPQFRERGSTEQDNDRRADVDRPGHERLGGADWRTEKGKAHGLAATLPRDRKMWDELGKQSLEEIEQRFHQIERERVRIIKLMTHELMEKTAPDLLERAIRRLANLDRYSARACTRLEKQVN
jgi:hypothetical protein